MKKNIFIGAILLACSLLWACNDSKKQAEEDKKAEELVLKELEALKNAPVDSTKIDTLKK